MLFVVLAKMRGAVDEEFSKKSEEFMKHPPAGIKIHQVLNTLERYDMKYSMKRQVKRKL